MMSSFPCQNQSCSSYGKPHPNCKCAGGMAEGGEVGGVCDLKQSHDEKCSYHLPPQDSSHAAVGFIARHGLPGMLNLHKISDLKKYQSAVDSGHKHIDRHAESLFSGDHVEPGDYERHREAIDKWVSKGGITDEIQKEIHEQNAPQAYAEGGEVEKKEHVHKHSVVSAARPEDHQMMQMSKARVADYLNGQRPQEHAPKLAFDHEPDQTQQKKSYAQARDLAIHPLGILEKIKKGTLEPEHLAHFSAMYPDLNAKLQQKLTEKITESQMSGKKPSAKVRQGLGTFLGAPLSGEMSPQNMQAAQAVFAAKQPAPAPGEAPKPKKNTAKLSKSDQSYLTGNQSLVGRQQRQ